MNKLGQSLSGTARPTRLHSQSYWHPSLCCTTQRCSAGPESAAVGSGTCHICSQSFTPQIHRLCHSSMPAAHQMLLSFTAAAFGVYSGGYSTSLHRTAKLTAYCFPVSHRLSLTALPPAPAIDSCMTLLLHTRLRTARQKAPAKFQATARRQASARHHQARPTWCNKHFVLVVDPHLFFSAWRHSKSQPSLCTPCISTLNHAVVEGQPCNSWCRVCVCAGMCASAPGVGPGRTGLGPRSTVWAWKTPLIALTTVPGPSPLTHLPLWPTSLGTP